MPIVTESYLRQRGGEEEQRLRESAGSILKKAAVVSHLQRDIFLCHSLRDEDLVLGAKRMLELHKLSVYVDWIDDPELDRSKVTKETAERLRDRLQHAKALVYLHTRHSESSRWMPWELGFFDGWGSKVAILPAYEKAGQQTFRGTEYLGIYPYIDRATDRAGKMRLWINADTKHYAIFTAWLENRANIQGHA